MARPKIPLPTPKELEALQVLWDHEPCTVREVMEVLNRRRTRAYSSVVNLLNAMTDKGLLMRKEQGRAFLYKARVNREKTRAGLAKDLLTRVFDDSPAALVEQILRQSDPPADVLDAIARLVAEYRGQRPTR